MHLKLTGLREVLGGPSDPGVFVHNFIFEEIRLMRKKRSLRLKNESYSLILTQKLDFLLVFTDFKFFHRFVISYHGEMISPRHSFFLR